MKGGVWFCEKEEGDDEERSSDEKEEWRGASLVQVSCVKRWRWDSRNILVSS